MTEHFRPAEPSAGAARPGIRAGSDLVSAKILVVDDDPRNLFAVEEMLRAPGLEIVAADSGEAALRHVLKDDFAVILLDVQMPRIDGYEVAGLIRNRPRSSRVPIIFLTAYNKDDLHVFRGYSAGAVVSSWSPRSTSSSTSTARPRRSAVRARRSGGSSWRTSGSAARS